MAIWTPILERGTYDGQTVDADFLIGVQRNFGALGIKPMLRRGHQPRPGAPAAGRVLDLRVHGPRLEALIEPTPDAIEDVRLKRYFQLSPGFRRLTDGSYTLDHIALLGEEHPAWKDQPELKFSELPLGDPLFFAAPPLPSGGRFATLDGQNEDIQSALDKFENAMQDMEHPMDMKEFSESFFTRLKDFFKSEKEAEKKALSDQLDALKQEFTEQLKTLREETKAARKEADELRAAKDRQEIIMFVEKGEREGRLPPALRNAGLIEFALTLDNTTMIEFKEGDKTAKMSQRAHFYHLLDQFPQVIHFGEFVSQKDLAEHSSGVLTDEQKARLRREAGLPEKKAA